MRLKRMWALVAACLVALVGLTVGTPGARADFGFKSSGVALTGPEGLFSRQAGAHADLTTRFTLNTKLDADGASRTPDGSLRDLIVDLPPGEIGNPQAAPTCTFSQLTTGSVSYPLCPIGAQVGIVNVAVHRGGVEGATITGLHIGLYNMVHSLEQPALFAFEYAGVVTTIEPRVRAGDYGISADSTALSSGEKIFGAEVTLWGVPADPSHDAERVYPDPGGNGYYGTASPDSRKPFLTNPTSCSATPDTIGLSADSWQNPGVFVSSLLTSDLEGTPLTTEGCDRVPFEPSMTLAPSSRVAGGPSGLDVDLAVPQDETPDGLATSDVRDVSVSLPQGMAVSPSSATGLGACTSSEIGVGQEGAPSCPDSSKIGTVEIQTPLLTEPLRGDVVLAQPNDNPFGSLLALYIVAKGPGFYLKLPGQVSADPVTGQLTASFEDQPQLPFSRLRLALNGGSRAPLVTPTGCGSYSASYQIDSWSGKTVSGSSPFTIDQGCGGGFAPAFTAGSSSIQAGAFSPFTLELVRAQTDQALGAVSLRTPPGLLGNLKSVAQCPEPQASQGTCGPQSLIGHTTVSAGPDPDPFTLGGQVFLTGPYGGAPFGLAIVVPAVAGPFNLGNVVVRAKIMVDPHTAALTVVSDPLPTILQGIPLDLRRVNGTVDRAGFMFNPTNCSPLPLGVTLSSAQGASVTLGTRFQAANCASLAFKPKFTVSTQAKSTRANGASLDVKLTSGAGQANVGNVAVLLPKQLPSRLSTIQKACLQATFAVNPGSCPAGSLVGTGMAVTPILAHPLSGPAYLVSHGGAAFPDLVVVLQGEGITVDLTGAINIKGSITSSTFANVPDVPITSFELKLPTGPHSALTSNVPAAAKGSLCGQSLVMPTTMTGQNGVQIKQSTKIAVTGCPKAKAKKKKVKANAKR